MITIFTDFDGVLFDTLREAYVLCRKVFYSVDITKAIEKNTFIKFARYKFLVFNSWQYLYLMKILSDKHIRTDEDFINNYNYMMKIRDYNEEREFDKKYLAERQGLLTKNPYWADKLEEKFPFFDMLVTLKDKFDIVIVSKNNRIEITRKLEKEKIKNIKVYAKEDLTGYKNKAEFIDKYMNENNIEKAYFIDDNSFNLRPSVGIQNLTCLQAGWGNIGISEKGLTKEEIYKIIQK